MSRAGVLVAAVGHAWLRDQAFGIKVIERLRREGVPAEVDLEDWSFGTITAFQKLSARSDRLAVFLAGEARGRTPGTLHRSRPSDALPPPEEIHARTCDCVMGMVSIENLLILGRHYGALPEDVVLIEAEPVDETWGGELSPRVAGLVDAAVTAVLEEVSRSGERSGRRQ